MVPKCKLTAKYFYLKVLKCKFAQFKLQIIINFIGNNSLLGTYPNLLPQGQNLFEWYHIKIDKFSC